jgi:hypothetical protein
MSGLPRISGRTVVKAFGRGLAARAAKGQSYDYGEGRLLGDAIGA